MLPAVGLTEDPSALRRWMVADPEVSRLVANYEAVSGAKDVKKGNHHHEQTEAAQKAIFEEVKWLTSGMREMGNPFTEESDDLLVLDIAREKRWQVSSNAGQWRWICYIRYSIECHAAKLPRHEAQSLMRALNVKQSQVFYNIRQWCLDKVNGKNPAPFHMFITGGAGTDKSHPAEQMQDS